MAAIRIAFAAVLFPGVVGLQLSDKASRSWPGLTSPLSEGGYQYILSTHDNTQMWRYIRRVVATYGGNVRNETGLDNFVASSWNKPEKQRTFDALITDLSTAKFLEGFSPFTAGELFAFPQAHKGPHTPSVSLFIAGVEGAGHQFIKRVMDSCVNLGACNIDPELTKDLWDSREDKAALAQAWSEAGARIQEFSNTTKKLRVLNGYGRADHMGELTYTGMMSYPSFSAQWVPRLDLYNAVAKEAGDRLYAVVLVRDAASILCSDFARYHHNEEEIIAALRSLTLQVRNLSPSSYRCIDYNALPAVPLTTNRFLSELLHSDRIGLPVPDMLARNFDSSNSTCATQVAPDAIERFTQALEPLYGLCRMADTSAPLVDVFSEAHAARVSSVPAEDSQA